MDWGQVGLHYVHLDERIERKMHVYVEPTKKLRPNYTILLKIILFVAYDYNINI